MALKPASGKKRGQAAKNDSNNKNKGVCTSAHVCIDPCPKGTLSCRKLFFSYCLPTYACQRISPARWQISEVLQCFIKTQSNNARTISDAITMLSPQYCRRTYFPFKNRRIPCGIPYEGNPASL